MNRLILAVSGVIVTLIGASGLLAPVWFHEAGGIRIEAPPALLSESRASGAILLAAGVYLLTGAAVPRLARSAAAVGVVVYLGTALSRLLSMAVDGSPGGGLLFATVVELALGLACAAILRRPRAAHSRTASPA